MNLMIHIKIGTISRKDSDVGVAGIYVPLQNLPTISKKVLSRINNYN